MDRSLRSRPSSKHRFTFWKTTATRGIVAPFAVAGSLPWKLSVPIPNYRYDDLTRVLHDDAAHYTVLARLQSIGTSFEGRDIRLVTITRFATGPGTGKPAPAAENTSCRCAFQCRRDRLLH
jgi:hypothetical protein